MKQFFQLGGTLRLDGDSVWARWPKGNEEARGIMLRLRRHRESVRMLLEHWWNRQQKCSHCFGQGECGCIACLDRHPAQAGVCAECGGSGLRRELVN
jgi:hypothetical protein